MSTKIALDDAATVDLTVHTNEECGLVFRTSSGETWDNQGKILISERFRNKVLVSYTVGNGVIISGDQLQWDFNPSDWGNCDVVYDFSFIRTPQNQRDIQGSITVKRALL